MRAPERSSGLIDFAFEDDDDFLAEREELRQVWLPAYKEQWKSKGLKKLPSLHIHFQMYKAEGSQG